jgi:L-rhamnose mutarotase
MKKQTVLIQKRKGVPFLLLFVFVYTNILAQAPTPVVHALVTTQKVAPADREEYEKLMKENWKALHQLRKQNGKIANWSLYKVHFAGSAEEYNYVSVTYYESFVKTEPNDNYLELMKASSPKADAAAILKKTQGLRSIQRQAIYARLDATTPKAGAPAVKYIIIDFMKAKPGMDAAYNKAERETWKPVHQALVEGDKRTGWAFWGLVVPGGTTSNHDYVTSNAFSNYAQIGGQDYEAAFKKVHPGKELQAIFEETGKARDGVRSELWELVVTLN